MSRPVGYSGTPLAKKLGVREGASVRFIQAPDGFLEGLAEMEPSACFDGEAPFDVILLFSTKKADLERHLPVAIQELKRDGGLWTCWPKKASKVPADIAEDDLRRIILPLGLVDNKVCAVTEVWSGLRFVWRKENR